jgi:hypothetical protein
MGEKFRMITLTPEISDALEFALELAYEDQRDYLRNFGLGDCPEGQRAMTASRKAQRYRVLADLKLDTADWDGLRAEMEKLAAE